MQNHDDDPPEFTDDQLRAALVRAAADARQEAFAAGLPVFVLKGGAVVAVYADGTEQIVNSLSAVTDASQKRE